jgi:hypothetical protein
MTGTLDANQTWAKDLPYLPSGLTVPSGKTLTVNSGTVVKFNGPFNSLEVDGVLNVNAASTSKAYFTSINDDSVGGDTNSDGTSSPPVPGDWPDIIVTTGATTTLNNAVVAYGGHNTFGEIYMTGGSLTISNSTVASSVGSGIYLDGGTVNIGSSTIAHNGSGLFNNTNVTSSATAKNDYWNASSGPFNANLNPGGTGDSVSDYVSFIPWATSTFP